MENKKSEEIRIDKFLWSVRIFKTRSIATEECKKKRVFINNMPVKPSKAVSVGEIIQVKKNPVKYTYKVLQLLKNRVGAKLVAEYIEDLTPEEELEKLKMDKYAGFFVRDRGTGRPTKKQRRELDKLMKE